MSTTNAQKTLPLCPKWCTLPLTHDPWGGEQGGREVRGHQGPRFGRFVTTGSFEYADNMGVQQYDLCVDPTAEAEIRTPAQARELAADLLAAAEWVETQQTNGDG